MTLKDLTQSIRTGIASSVLEKGVPTGNAQPYGLVKMTNIPEHGGWITAPESNISADPGKRLDAVILEEGDVLISVVNVFIVAIAEGIGDELCSCGEIVGICDELCSSDGKIVRLIDSDVVEAATKSPLSVVE